MQNFSIEKAKRKDAQVVLEIRKAAIHYQCIDHYPAAILKIWTDGGVSEEFADAVAARFYVAKVEGKIVGTGMINVEEGKIDAIFVHPDYMRKGIGTGIIRFLEKIALDNGLEKLALESTLNAATFYRSCGFTGYETGTYQSPSGISLDCIPMIKLISS